MDNIEYRRGLATWDLIVEVRQLLATERRTERLVCRYLADLADRVQQRQDLALARYADELHAARSCFGLGAREARERIRVGRALRQLPEVERAFVEGELSYSRVREVTRIATAADESEWLELARRLDMRALERRVASARAPLLDDEASGCEAARKTRPTTRRVTFELSERAYELFQQALESARKVSGGCTDAEALERLASEALSARARDTDGADAAGIVRPTATGPSCAQPPCGEPSRTEPSRTEPSRPESCIQLWSWDELGWGTTQRGSWDEHENQDVDVFGEGVTQRGSCDNDDEGHGADAFDRCATQSGPSDNDDESKAVDALGGSATQRESPERDDDGRGAAALEVDQRKGCEREDRKRERERWIEVNSRLLRAMGGGGRWIADTLIEASGLSASEVNSALTYLQLSGRIRRRADAFEPI